MYILCVLCVRACMYVSVSLPVRLCTLESMCVCVFAAFGGLNGNWKSKFPFRKKLLKEYFFFLLLERKFGSECKAKVKMMFLLLR